MSKSLDMESKDGFFATDGKHCVSIYSNENEGAVIGFYQNMKHPTSQGCDLAFCVTPDGKKSMQIIVDGKAKFIDLERLVAMMEWFENRGIRSM